jgi:hypothetical protein
MADLQDDMRVMKISIVGGNKSELKIAIRNSERVESSTKILCGWLEREFYSFKFVGAGTNSPANPGRRQ